MAVILFGALFDGVHKLLYSVVEHNGEILYVQVVYSVIDSKTHEWEFGNLLAYKIIIRK